MFRLLLLCTLLSAASLQAAPPRSPTDVAAESTTAFGVATYQQVRAHKGNLFFSPVSLLSALGLAASGARGETRSQMNKVLCLPDDDAAASLAPLLKSLTSRAARGTRVQLAAGLWSQKGPALRDGFVASARKLGGTTVAQADFAAQPAASRKAINAWVEKHTNNRVKDLLPAGSVTRETRIILASAIHFRGDWAYPFRKEDTRDGEFHAPAGKVKAPFMRQRGEFAFRAGPALAALELPFAGNEVSMVFLLPNAGIPLEDIEKALNTKQIAGWLRDLRVTKVDIAVPRFRLAVQYDLKDALSSMGMPLAFGAKADFSGMSAGAKLQLSDVFHRAYVDVNEKGSEAGAATAIAVTPKAIEGRIPAFKADRPFLFLILDRKTDSILFLGRLSQPRAG